MPVINFDGADKVILRNEADRAYLGDELVWRLRDGSFPVFLDVIRREKNAVFLDIQKVSPVLLPNFMGTIKLISEDGKKIVAAEPQYSFIFNDDLWMSWGPYVYSSSTNKRGQAKLLEGSGYKEIFIKITSTTMPESVTKLAIQLEDGSWFGKRA